MCASQMVSDPARETLRHVLLAQGRPVFDASGGNEMDGVGIAAEGSSAGGHIVGEDPVAALLLQLLLRMLDDMLGLGGEAYHQARPRLLGVREGSQDVGIGGELE